MCDISNNDVGSTRLKAMERLLDSPSGVNRGHIAGVAALEIFLIFIALRILILDIQHSYDANRGFPGISEIYLNLIFLIGLLLFGLLYIILFFVYKGNQKRYYVVFSLLSPYNKESKFSFSNFTSLFSRGSIVKSVETPSFVRESATSPLTRNKFQSTKFEMRNSWFLHRYFFKLFAHSFVISSYENEGTNSNFIFYTRDGSSWNKIQKFLETNNLIVEALQSKKIRIKDSFQ